ncbi:hypothetical protein P4534_18670 [Peribacillus butanolivorans]|uniref:hypothetical protein n=2 Tax=Bacillaceae TaxID=186817 RepID=UPI002E2390DD|nr:hypothetical protein [Peribacillus butanolivorans]
MSIAKNLNRLSEAQVDMRLAAYMVGIRRPAESSLFRGWIQNVIFSIILWKNRFKKLFIGGDFMWVITVYSRNNYKIFEFDTEKEAKEAFKGIKGYKILTEVIYFNDYDLVKS